MRGRVMFMVWPLVYVVLVLVLGRWLRRSPTPEPESEPRTVPVHRCSFEVLHLVPKGDVIDHVCGGEVCVCGPSVELRVGVDGVPRWVALHHALAAAPPPV